MDCNEVDKQFLRDVEEKKASNVYLIKDRHQGNNSSYERAEWKKMIHAKHDADWEINRLHETINYLICYHMTGNLIGTKGIKSQLSEKYRIKLLKVFF